LGPTGEDDDDEERGRSYQVGPSASFADCLPLSATRRRGLIRRAAVIRITEIPGRTHGSIPEPSRYLQRCPSRTRSHYVRRKKGEEEGAGGRNARARDDGRAAAARNRGRNLRKVSNDCCEDADIYLRVSALRGVRTVSCVTVGDGGRGGEGGRRRDLLRFAFRV